MTSPNMWSSADAYEQYMGRWSRLVAASFVSWLGMPEQSAWLDVGCGTGALTDTILHNADPSRVVGVDPSVNFIAEARQRNNDGRASFEVASAQLLPPGLKDFDAVVSGLVLNFVPDRAAGLRQMVMATRPGGVVAAYVWDYADGMQPLRWFWDTASALNPEATQLDEGRRDSICNPGALSDLFSQELADVEVAPIVVPAIFQDFDDYWTPFLGGVGPAPSYVASLDEGAKEALENALRHRLAAVDGAINLTARAWAVSGVRRTT